MKVSIVIPAFNNWNYTKQAINDLFFLPIDHEIILIDNGSQDYTKHLNHDRVQIIRNRTNKGYAKASNQGYERSRGEYIIFLNNDIKVKLGSYDDWTEPLLNQASTGALVSPTAGLLTAFGEFQRESDTLEAGNSYLSAWCLCGLRSTYQKLTAENSPGPFSEDYGLGFFEDVDLSFRAKELGIELIVQPINVHHFGHQTAKLLGTNKLYSFAKAVFVKKWLSNVEF